MNHILRSPTINGVCISLFTAFYGLIFIVTSRHIEFVRLLYYVNIKQNLNSFWNRWSNFLASGHHAYIAYALIAITILIVILLVLRQYPYDEYHISILSQCLSIATVLTLIAIAIFYLIILSDTNGIIEKFTLFIAIHWTTVVLADLAYVLLCRWR